MTTDRVFNTSFENSLRLLILLDLYDMPQNLDTLYAVDFMTQYGETFGISDSELNGVNHFMFSEFASKREIIREALKLLVMNGMVQPLNLDEGILYTITSEGEDYCMSLDSEYASEYRNAAKKIMEKYDGWSERKLISYIRSLSEKGLDSN